MAARRTVARHVFISYAREDRAYVRELAGALRGRGFEIWMDDRIDFGARWWREIVKAVRASAAFVIVMTPDSEDSEWVEREILLAQREEKPIFPLLLRGQENPLLITIQYANVSGGRLPPEAFYLRLARVLPPESEIETRPYEAPSQPVAKPQAAPPAALERRQPFEPELILIPAGEFLMGSDPGKDKDAREEEQPQHSLYLPDYTIARTPVTNAQYRAFVEATGYAEPDGWESGQPPAGKEDHPVVFVDWPDAKAYCRWLAETTGQAYRLPSEAEWEKAARGTDGRIYPWGDEPPDEKRCNYGDNVEDTTPVGRYSPLGDSPYGCVDTAGNVWEWCHSLDKPYPYDLNDGREDPEAEGTRVLRGGSWDFIEEGVRAAACIDAAPAARSATIGFRCVAGPGG